MNNGLTIDAHFPIHSADSGNHFCLEPDIQISIFYAPSAALLAVTSTASIKSPSSRLVLVLVLVLVVRAQVSMAYWISFPSDVQTGTTLVFLMRAEGIDDVSLGKYSLVA